ncbi:unnamed protein product [Heligmosomoides polygyrus]|uniref:LLGL domain-containing protein n=1 Tax=Heligmosomoides polygyrus TaxID=6339 RepID=A0A183GAH0_HELPZ|nr:unnamed protein product [Heligmosomoides polygyrus]
MTCEKIGDALKSAVAEPCEYHHALLTGDHIWLFGQKFVNQPSHNWGHRVALAGTYGVAFNLANNKWEEPHNFPALSQEENVSEILFVLNNAVYILLFSAFGELSMKSVHKWSGKSWESVKLESFPTIAGADPAERVTMAVAEGPHADSRYLVSTVGRQIRVAHLKLSGDSMAITHVLDVPDDAAMMGAQAVSAVETGDRLLISYGVHGCGFRWEKNRFILCEPSQKKCTALQITSEAAPKWGFNGAMNRYLSPSGAWVHVGGSVPSGMTGSSFDGSVWALTNLGSNPTWHQLQGSIPSEGNVVIGSGRIVSVDQNGVHSMQLKEN